MQHIDVSHGVEAGGQFPCGLGDRGDAAGKDPVGPSSIGEGAGKLSLAGMIGHGPVGGPVFPAPVVRVPLIGFIEELKQVVCVLDGDRVFGAVFRGPVHEIGMEGRVSLEVSLQGGDELRERHPAVDENPFLNGVQGVHRVGEADVGCPGGVVASSAKDQVSALFQGALEERRQKRGRENLLVGLPHHLVELHRLADQPAELRLEGFPESLEGLEGFGRARGRSDLFLFGDGSRPVVKSKLQRRDEIQHDGTGGVIAAARGGKLHAADDGKIPGILCRDSLVFQGADGGDIIVEGRHRSCIGDDLRHPVAVFNAVLSQIVAGVETRIAGLQKFRNPEHDVGQVVDCILAFFINSADRHRRDGSCTTEELLAGFGDEVGVVVELQPEAADQFHGFLQGQFPVGNVPRIPGIEDLVEASGTHGHVDIFGMDSDLKDPEAVDRLPESPCRLCRNLRADGCHGFEVLSADRVPLLPGQL
ncbi:MAG: hypothetical protein A4E72_00753 [Syntrophus sp. PtaU1.Bin208]|nr:MAG: hypothetical protein A4E72_00753 [Syntrophus sp. PtaU1.Bin208]